MAFKRNLLFLSIFVLISLTFGFFNSLPVRAQTLEQLLDEIAGIEAQLQNLRAQLKGLQSVPSACVEITFERNLRGGTSGADVKCLQALLNTDPTTQVASSGLGSFGNESNYFGFLTTSALIKFQEKYADEVLTPVGLTKGTGFAGPKTIIKLNSLLNPPPPEPVSPSAPTVSLSANFSSVAPGQPLNLSWTSFNTISCSGTNFPTNQVTNGSASVAPRQTTTYFISCEGSQGSVSADVTVTVSSGGGSSGGGGGGGGLESAPPGGSFSPSIGCFLAGTKITMADGKYKNIEEIKVGDFVRYYDFKEKAIKPTRVKKISIYSPEEMSADYYLVINNKLRVTPSQPLDNPEGKMIWSKDLKVGDKLQGENGVIEISSIEKVQERATTYYLETESGHYFVDGIADAALKVFKEIENLFASIVTMISKLVRIIESMR